MNEKDLLDLLGNSESEWLDYKQQWPDNTVTLIHDLLCLMNAYAESDRFLVFGVDDSQNVVGVESDDNRKSAAEVHDLIRNSKFNRSTSLNVKSFDVHGKTVDVVIIADRPDKPFYLKADKRKGKETIRAGVIYTRLGSTNIPLKECAPDDLVELMWRERFGFDLTPLERFERLVDERSEWVHVEDDSYIYHNKYPEFTICDGKGLNLDFKESWTVKFMSCRASSFEVELKYHSTILKRLVFVNCDGGRYRLPLPDPIHKDNGGGYKIEKDSLAFRVAHLFSQAFDDIETILRGAGVNIIE
ncbi:AlbA family DNA-binding domain-containing protein [Lujinxingia sediminis]|uniref:AlbA family DNA-binding domain-containing protein n=1 Tax=Lujinxingia sediminis TaxID=2480984 RepID=UPI0013E36919|nr:ATP-binding protein [Lujinxingia sediminis]